MSPRIHPNIVACLSIICMTAGVWLKPIIGEALIWTGLAWLFLAAGIAFRRDND